MKLNAIGFSNFRSIGADPVFIDLGTKVNVLVGPNNAGKSNMFRALESIKCDNKERQKATSQLDHHKRNAGNAFCLTLLGSVVEDDSPLLKLMGEFKIACTVDERNREFTATPFDEMDFNTFSRLFEELTKQRFNRRPVNEEMPKFRGQAAEKLVGPLLSQIPGVEVIPAIRKVDKGEQYGLDGAGAIQTLAKWRHPDIGQDHLEKKLHQVQELLRRLLKMPKVQIEVPDTKDKIIVRNNGLRLPLESYGTGIHELLILAIDIYSKKNVIFCVEEPEIHLHPRLQREFMRFLIEETDNRYLLATHSHALMIPSEDVAITHLWLEDGVTKSQRVETSAHTLQVLSDLGVAASDLLQANSVVWVEGPSDRVYLNRWINLLAPDLREGIDYSIMFYGGRLLAHLSLDREESTDTKDLVRLLRMNQHSAIVIDSDRSSAKSDLNQTKQRVCSECKEHNIPCWVTDGREIENYIPASLLEDAYEEMTEARRSISYKRFAKLEQALKKAYGTTWRAKWSYDRAKVDMARRITARFEMAHFTDELKPRVEQLIKMIRTATGRAGMKVEA